MRNILVTGGAGNIGGAMACALAADERNFVVVLDNLSTGRRENVPERNCRFIHADVNDASSLQAVFAHYRFDVVFHYAALVGVQRTLADPIGVLRDLEGIRHLLHLCHISGVQRVFYSSSSEVYGEPMSLPLHEEDSPLNARLPYAVVKKTCEVWLKAYQRQYGLPYTILRFFNTYGPRQTTDFVVAKFISAVLHGQPLTIYGDGQQTRTFLYVDDNVQVVKRMLDEGLCLNETINIGSDLEMSVLQLAETVQQALGQRTPLRHMPALPEGDMRHRRPDNTRMRSLLAAPLLPLDEGIRRTANYLRRLAS